MKHPFFDSPTYPWHLIEAQILHRSLYQAVGSPNSIENLYLKCDPNPLPLALSLPADQIWSEVLNRLARNGHLKAAVEIWQVDPVTRGNAQLRQAIESVKNACIPDVDDDPDIPKMLKNRRLRLVDWKTRIQHTYNLLCNQRFVGRPTELNWLDRWAGLEPSNSETPADSPVLCLHALGGGGKTALAWEWISRNQGQGGRFEKAGYVGVFWCSFYTSGYDFERFLEDSLEFLEVSIPVSQDPYDRWQTMTRCLLDELERNRYLFVLDGVERKLAAFAGEDAKGTDDHSRDEQIEKMELTRYDRSMLDPEAGRLLRSITERLARAHQDRRSQILMTSRVPPDELSGAIGFHCRKVDGFSRDDALLLWKQAGCTGGRVADVCKMFERWGYHPLVIAVLAMAVKHSRAAGDFDKWLSFPENKDFDPTSQSVGLSKTTLRQRALDVILNYLEDAAWQVLECISTHPDASPFRFLAALLVTRLQVFPSEAKLWDQLRDLHERGLVGQDGDGELAQFDSHPVIRDYVWKRHQNAEVCENRRRRILEAFGNVLNDYSLQNGQDIPDDHLSVFHQIGWCRLLLDEKKYDEAWKLYSDRLRPRLVLAQMTEIDESLLQRWFGRIDDSSDIAILPKLKNHADRALALELRAQHLMVRGRHPDLVDRLMRLAGTEYLLGGDQTACVGTRAGRLWRVFYEGQLFEAEVELRRLVIAASKAGLRTAASRVGFWTCLVLAMRGRVEEFAQLFEAVRPAVLELDRRWALQGLAESYYYLGFLDEALKSLDDLNKRPDEEPDPSPGQKSWEHLTAGMVYLDSGNLSASEHHLNQAIRLSRRRWDRVVEGFATVALGRWNLENGLPDESRRLIEVNYSTIDPDGKWSPIAAEACAVLAMAGGTWGNQSQSFQGEKKLTPAEIGLERAYCDGPPFVYQLWYDRLLKIVPTQLHKEVLVRLRSRLPTNWESQLIPIDELIEALNSPTPVTPSSYSAVSTDHTTDNKPTRRVLLRSPSSIGRLELTLPVDEAWQIPREKLPTMIVEAEAALNVSRLSSSAAGWWSEFKIMNAPLWVHRVCQKLQAGRANLPGFIAAAEESNTADLDVLIASARQIHTEVAK